MVQTVIHPAQAMLAEVTTFAEVLPVLVMLVDWWVVFGLVVQLSLVQVMLV